MVVIGPRGITRPFCKEHEKGGYPVAELRSAWADETSAPTQPAACADEMSAHTKNRAEEKCIDPSLGVLRERRTSLPQDDKVVIGRRSAWADETSAPTQRSHTKSCGTLQKRRRHRNEEKQIPRRSRHARAPASGSE